ncbi:uncharacterized protein DUF4263 [Paraburkholderia sp. BL6669N2]|uniref:Shedu immune nuclease family protein n=1 Tax=Paraburkholderia sp. BL6669N2 TaxID=1938807 RepID=UPI000E377F30|nr:Shedu immune nuclease family protein [Paraburkholderia sp. BL6669N2]REG50877.1 uncharacterized protein DUF4263 [Paraburkholderia sp. BL6669N2]
MEGFTHSQVDPTKWASMAIEAWPLVATVTCYYLRMYPVFSNPHAQRYLTPKHHPFQYVEYRDGNGHDIPSTADDAIAEVTSRLPWGVFKRPDEGFGFAKELEHVVRTVGRIVNTQALIVVSEGNSRLADGEVIVSEDDMDALRRAMNRIDRRKRDGISREKSNFVFNHLLVKLDPEHFGRIGYFPADSTPPSAKTSFSRQATKLRRQADAAAVARVRASLPSLAAEAPSVLMQLRAEIEKVTLSEMIDKFDRLLAEDLSESGWQTFFEAHQFILEMVFARPVQLLVTQFHAQVSSLMGTGAQIGDFLFRRAGRGLAIVEIKKPATQLVSVTPYRNTTVFAPSKELSGAVTQVLFQQSAIRSNWLVHQGTTHLRDASPDAVSCIVIAGRLPTEENQLRSFDVFRNACKDVEVVTFDELLAKLRHVRNQLGDSSPDGASVST